MFVSLTNNNTQPVNTELHSYKSNKHFLNVFKAYLNTHGSNMFHTFVLILELSRVHLFYFIILCMPLFYSVLVTNFTIIVLVAAITHANFCASFCRVDVLFCVFM